MQAIETALTMFFEKVAKKDQGLIKNLMQEKNFSLENNRWCFTLPDLYSFLQYHDDAFGQIEYKQFRQLIFNNPINTAIKIHGAEIAIADNQSKVDKSTYALIWQI